MHISRRKPEAEARTGGPELGHSVVNRDFPLAAQLHIHPEPDCPGQGTGEVREKNILSAHLSTRKRTGRERLCTCLMVLVGRVGVEPTAR